MRTNRIKHVIWDWNGTLLDDTVVCLNTINRMLAKRGLSTMDLVQYRNLFGFPVRDCYIKLGFDLVSESWNAVSHEFHDIYRVEARYASLREGIVPLLEMLAASGMTMSVLSASEQSVLCAMMEERGVARFFKNVYGHSNNHGSSKIALGKKFLSDTGISSDHILMVGDTDHDYEVALELNCRCILLVGGHQAEERLRRCNCEIVQDLNEYFEGS